MEPVPELYDLELDPSEPYNVAGQYPEVVAQLRAKMAELERELSGSSVGESQRDDDKPPYPNN